MNYYPRYIGDYVAATLHLTMQQDGAFTRLLDWSYANERPIPHANRYAIARATTAREKADVDAVLGEFFQQGPEGWVNERVSKEVERARPKMEAARSNGRKGGRPRTKEPIPEPKENPLGFEDGTQGDAQQGTGTEPSTKAPHPQNQSDTEASRQAHTTLGGTEAGRACRLMREAGCQGTNPSHPDLIAALEAGVTPEALAATAAEGIEAGKAKPFAWACITARSRHLEGPRTINPSTGAVVAMPSWQARGVADILGADPHDIAENPRPVVREADLPVPGHAVPAEPRRVAGV